MSIQNEQAEVSTRKNCQREQTARNNLVTCPNSREIGKGTLLISIKKSEVRKGYVAKARARVPALAAGMTKRLDPLLRKRANTFRLTHTGKRATHRPFLEKSLQKALQTKMKPSQEVKSEIEKYVRDREAMKPETFTQLRTDNIIEKLDAI